MSGGVCSHLFRLLAVVALMAGGCAGGRELTRAPALGSPHARVLLARRCVGCHAVPDPLGMSQEEWLAGLERMKRRMTLPSAEWDSLASLAADTQR